MCVCDYRFGGHSLGGLFLTGGGFLGVLSVCVWREGGRGGGGEGGREGGKKTVHYYTNLTSAYMNDSATNNYNGICYLLQTAACATYCFGYTIYHHTSLTGAGVFLLFLEGSSCIPFFTGFTFSGAGEGGVCSLSVLPFTRGGSFFLVSSLLYTCTRDSGRIHHTNLY